MWHRQRRRSTVLATGETDFPSAVLLLERQKKTNADPAGTAGPADERRPRWVVPLLCLLAFLGLGALFGGGSLILDPSGASLGLPAEFLEGSVFPDYLVPGIVLFCVLGIGSFVVVYGVLRSAAWAWPAGLALGGATLVWLLVQVLIIRTYFYLQPVIATVGVFVVVLFSLPSMRRHYRAAETLRRLGFGRRRD